MGFWQSISSGIRRAFDFDTRSSRSEFWYWFLFLVLAGIVCKIIDAGMRNDTFLGYGPVYGMFWFVSILPTIAVGVRRLHDTNRNGAYYLVNAVPVLGWIVFYYWACLRGTEGSNRFGFDPLYPHRHPRYQEVFE